LNPASLIYGAVATWRRRWYGDDPARRRRLRRPVISVGNLRVGGSGKTPVVATIARLLVEQGERPSVLSRGYGRSMAADGVTVVSNGRSILTDVRSAGDEPLMLARALPAVAVLVGADRYLSGRLAEEKLGVTVHLLDDGFQHFGLARDVDFLVSSEEDLTDSPLPTGRLREPLAVAAQAVAARITASYAEAALRVGRALGVSSTFRVARTISAPWWVATRETVVVPDAEPVFAVAGIASPQRFFSDLESAGWRVVGAMAFRDHHPFTDRDVARIAAAARAAGATVVMTTEKDAVRFEAVATDGVPIAAVPLTVTIEPAGEFRRWIGARLALARREKPSAGDPPATSDPWRLAALQ
jgi:tetraacyldisaccharide 4'-kinase